MRRLMLLRHAKSDRPSGIADFDRPLSPRGAQDCQLLGAHFAANGMLPDLTVVSSASRTQLTWEILRQTWTEAVAERTEPRLYEARATALLDIVAHTSKDIGTLLLIGHNPSFHEVALDLVGNTVHSDLPALRINLPTAGLVVIDLAIDDWSQIKSTSGALVLFTSPRRLGSEHPIAD